MTIPLAFMELRLLLLFTVTLTHAFQISVQPHPIHSSTRLSLSQETTTLLNDTLIRWLLASGCHPDIHSVRIDTIHGLRGLYANRDVNEGEIIFEIPYSLALETGDTLKDGEDGGYYLIGSDLDDVDCEEWDKETVYDVYQGLSLLHRMEEDDDWIWDPYLCNLPELPESCNESGLTPDFWSDELIEEMEVPSFIKDVMNRKQIVKIVAEKNDVDEHELRWITWLIRSRRFTTWDRVDDPIVDDEPFGNNRNPKKVEQIKGFLLPLIDMANHAHKPNAVMKITVNPWTKEFDETSSFALYALEPINKDDQITISYGDGDWTCLQMMDKYGFFMEKNPADEIFDWKHLDCAFSTSLQQDEEEKLMLLKNKGENIGSRLDMLTLRIHIKQWTLQ